MERLLLFSQIVIFTLFFLIGLNVVLIRAWPINELTSESRPSLDVSVDDWLEQNNLYGIAFCRCFPWLPAGIISNIIFFIGPHWTIYLLALVSFWFGREKIMTATTRLRFEKPKTDQKLADNFPCWRLRRFGIYCFDSSPL